MEKQVTHDNFQEEVIQSELPVLIDFWAEWCGPCRAVNPTVAAIAQENQGRLKVCKINVDQSPELAQQFGVMSIPTFVVFQGGKAVDQWSGALPKDGLTAKVAPYLKANLNH
jgi:thioredoxin 1